LLLIKRLDFLHFAPSCRGYLNAVFTIGREDAMEKLDIEAALAELE